MPQFSFTFYVVPQEMLPIITESTAAATQVPLPLGPAIMLGDVYGSLCGVKLATYEATQRRVVSG